MAQPGFPTTAEAITPAWLTEVLRADGVLGASGMVVGFEEAPLGAGIGFMSALRRLTFRYAGETDGPPATAIVKLPAPDPGARQIDELFHFYDNEVGFYRLIAPSRRSRRSLPAGGKIRNSRGMAGCWRSTAPNSSLWKASTNNAGLPF